MDFLTENMDEDTIFGNESGFIPGLGVDKGQSYVANGYTKISMYPQSQQPAPKRKHKNRNKAMRRLNPYLLYGNDRRSQLQIENPSLSAAEIMKILAVEWKSLPEQTKDYYKQKSLAQKYEIEQENALGITRKRKRRTKKEMEEARALEAQKNNSLSGYLYFAKEYQPKVMELNPNCSMPEITKAVQDKWRSMTPEEKAPFEKMGKPQNPKIELPNNPKPESQPSVPLIPSTSLQEFTTTYLDATFQFFKSQMSTSLKSDYNYTDPTKLSESLTLAWSQLTLPQKHTYFLQNKSEIQDYISILEDQCTLPASPSPPPPPSPPTVPSLLSSLSSLESSLASPSSTTVSLLSQVSDKVTQGILSDLDLALLVDSTEKLKEINGVLGEIRSKVLEISKGVLGKESEVLGDVSNFVKNEK